MSRRSMKWRARTFPALVEKEPQTRLEAHLMSLKRLWDAVIPKCARSVKWSKTGTHIDYLHPTKGWRSIHKGRFNGADALLPA